MKCEVCILAGGLSTRMGRDKARLRLTGQSMLSLIRATAQKIGCPVRVIRRDDVPRCGPLGGVLTALKSARSNAVLFLACDMPFVSATLLRKIIRASHNGTAAVFASEEARLGFPFLLSRTALATVDSQIAQRRFSICELAAALRAVVLPVPAASGQLFNVNTAADAAVAQCGLVGTRRKPDASLVTRGVRPYGSRHAKSADCSIARRRSRRQRPR
jgi:molybdopterin-guanine dinucleotide biosynthesis protein A